MALDKYSKILEDVYDVIAMNNNYITQKEFSEKYDMEIDYTKHIITITSEEDPEVVVSLTLNIERL